MCQRTNRDVRKRPRNKYLNVYGQTWDLNPEQCLTAASCRYNLSIWASKGAIISDGFSSITRHSPRRCSCWHGLPAMSATTTRRNGSPEWVARVGRRSESDCFYKERLVRSFDGNLRSFVCIRLVRPPRSVRPSVYLSVRPRIRPLIRPSFLPSVLASGRSVGTFPFVRFRPSFHPTVPIVLPSVRLSGHPSTRFTVRPSDPPSVRSFVNPFIHPSDRPSVRL